MKRIGLFLVGVSLLFGACNSKVVKVQGKIEGLSGTVKLLAELPGERGLVILDQREVQHGEFSLKTERLVIPARVWVDISGRKDMLDIILDTWNKTLVTGHVDSLDQIKIAGSEMMTKYESLRENFQKSFGDEVAKIDEKIWELNQKEKKTRDEEVSIGMSQLRKQQVLGQRANAVRRMVEKNLSQELSLFLIKDELVDSLMTQRRLFDAMTVVNTESNIYKLLESKLK